MRILVILNYYYPYVSGLSEYARLLCEGMARKGNEVTVLTSNHARLVKEEIINNVRVIRAPVWFKVSKGVISPKFVIWALKYAKNADIVNLHLPMLESGVIASLLSNRKLLCTYHCDINLPSGLMNNMILYWMNKSHNVALKNARYIVVNTLEYIKVSRIADRYMSKMKEVPPPIKDLPILNHSKHEQFRIGFCGRIVEEKGIDVLIKAFEMLQKEKDNVELVIGGDYETIAGGSIYSDLKKYINAHCIQNVYFTGKIPEEKMADFYSSLDLFVLPSVNSLESFGMVQIEAMLCGIPVIASNLPGVRTIIQKTGMGLICKKGDAWELKNCILRIMNNYSIYCKSRSQIEEYYGIDKSVTKYLDIIYSMK